MAVKRRKVLVRAFRHLYRINCKASDIKKPDAIHAELFMLNGRAFLWRPAIHPVLKTSIGTLQACTLHFGFI